jgi:hypothetical protein
MKTFLILSFLAVVFGEFEPHDTNHYSQHTASVNAAKAGVAQRLAKLEDTVASTGALNQVQYSSGHTAGGTQRYVAGCSYCVDTGYASANRTGSAYDTRSSTRSGSSDLTNSDYVGVGFVGHSSDMRNSRLSSSRSDDVQTVAVPTYSSSSSMKYTEAEDMQQRQVPVVYPTERQSSRYSSASNQESYRAEQAVPVYRPVTVASARYSSSASNQESSASRTESTPVYIPGSSRTYSQHADQHNADQQASNTYYIPSTGRYTVYARPGSTTYLRVPVRVPEGDVQTGVRSDHSESGSSSSNTRSSLTGGQNSIVYRPVIYNETASTYRSENRAERVIPGVNRQVIYYPVVQDQTVSDRQTSENKRSETRNYETYRPAAITERSQSRQSQAESSHSQTRYVAPTNVPRNGGPSRYPYAYSRYSPAPVQSSQTRTVAESREDESELSQTRIPATHSSSYGTSRQHESRSQYGSSGYQIPVRSSSAQHSDRRSESSLSSSRVVPVRIEPTEYESRRQSSSASRQEGHTQYGGVYTPSYTSSNRNIESGSSHGQREYVRGGVLPSTRFGSSVLETDTDLNSYMSESEKLARLQAKSISSGTSSTYGSSNIDEINRRTLQQAESLDAASADFVNSQSGNQLSLDGLDASSLGTGGIGGFKRVKSWQKQSKWASGSEYGPDGKPKSYSMLSTAESEKHNINGAETGFKAATTTLEDDGKVSTYSIHTP